MNRTCAGVLAGALATGVFCASAQWVFDASNRFVSAGAIGGALGTALASASCGAQVAILRRRPGSNASLAAFAAGFFAKLAALATGILLMRGPDSPFDPLAFGFAFVASAALATVVTLSQLVSTSPSTH